MSKKTKCDVCSKVDCLTLTRLSNSEIYACDSCAYKHKQKRNSTRMVVANDNLESEVNND